MQFVGGDQASRMASQNEKAMVVSGTVDVPLHHATCLPHNVTALGEKPPGLRLLCEIIMVSLSVREQCAGVLALINAALPVSGKAGRKELNPMAIPQEKAGQHCPEMRWLGVAGIELRANEQILVIDPFVSRPPLRRMWWGRVRSDTALVASTVPHGDFVLVTHAHWDHVMDVPAVIDQTRATAFGSPNACQLLAILGVPQERLRKIKVGDQLTLGTFQVETFSAEHGLVLGRPFASGPLAPHLRPPLRMRDYRMDACFSFLIEVGGHRFLDWSSERVHSAPRADVLFVKPQQQRAYYEVLLGVVQPRVVIPIHWDDLMRPLSEPLRPMLKPPRLAFPPLARVDLTAFSQLIKRIAPQTQVVLPEIFRLYDLSVFL
jgi:L-ascorbate metabolism protein UlaG (beta-lactamase superfamily)